MDNYHRKLGENIEAITSRMVGYMGEDYGFMCIGKNGKVHILRKQNKGGEKRAIVYTAEVTTLDNLGETQVTGTIYQGGEFTSIGEGYNDQSALTWFAIHIIMRSAREWLDLRAMETIIRNINKNQQGRF